MNIHAMLKGISEPQGHHAYMHVKEQTLSSQEHMECADRGYTKVWF